MDLLTGYGSGSDSDDDNQELPAASTAFQPARPAASAPPAAASQQRLPNPFAPPAAQQAGLPNPFLDEPVTARNGGSTNPAGKRPFAAVAGHSLPTAVSKPKAAKDHAAARPAAQPKGAAAMLPPQLMGRSNVVTEDIDKLFTKRTPGTKPADLAGPM